MALSKGTFDMQQGTKRAASKQSSGKRTAGTSALRDAAHGVALWGADAVAGTEDLSIAIKPILAVVCMVRILLSYANPNTETLMMLNTCARCHWFALERFLLLPEVSLALGQPKPLRMFPWVQGLQKRDKVRNEV